MNNYTKRNDKMLSWIGLSFALAILGIFVLKGIMPWVLYLGIIFVLLAIHAEREAEKKAVCDKSDYKAMYNPPEEEILGWWPDEYDDESDEYSTKISQEDINETIDAVLKENDR